MVQLGNFKELYFNNNNLSKKSIVVIKSDSLSGVSQNHQSSFLYDIILSNHHSKLIVSSASIQ
ncbi:hypothetical protein HOG21_01065 [bacterium]|nr:hypothetical protein [bacterium]